METWWPNAWALAQELLALFGALCLVLNLFLPLTVATARFVAVHAPREISRWKTNCAQQNELQRLKQQLASLRSKVGI